MLETIREFALEGIGAAQAALGWVALAEGRSDDASDGFRESLGLINETGHLVSVPGLLLDLPERPLQRAT